VHRFRHASSDLFFVCIESKDRKFDLAECSRLLQEVHAHHPTELALAYASRCLAAACAVASLIFGGGCEYLRQDMANQPKNRPLSPSEFFGDGRSERPPVENTVARGSLADDELFVPKNSNNFPLTVDLKLLERGEERYKIFCSPCHGLQGDGNGFVVMRGMKAPPSYHQDRLRQAPNGYIYDVTTNGFG